MQPNVFLPGDSIIFNFTTATPVAIVTWHEWPTTTTYIRGISLRGQTGTATVYTCPIGKRASLISTFPSWGWCQGSIRASWNNGSTSNFTWQIRIGGVASTMGFNSVFTGTSQTIGGGGPGPYLNAGESFEIVIQNVGALNCIMAIICELPSTNFTMKKEMKEMTETKEEK